MANPNSPLSAIVARTGLFCAYRPALRVPASSARTGLTGWRLELDMDLDMDGPWTWTSQVARGYQIGSLGAIKVRSLGAIRHRALGSINRRLNQVKAFFNLPRVRGPHR